MMIMMAKDQEREIHHPSHPRMQCDTQSSRNVMQPQTLPPRIVTPCPNPCAPPVTKHQTLSSALRTWLLPGCANTIPIRRPVMAVP